MRLTDIACKNAKPSIRAYKKTDAHGLYLYVTPNGSRYWRLKYRFAGKERVLALGVYPEVSLLEAREKRERARKLLASDIDPVMARQQQKHMATISSEHTFEAVAREWHENQKEKWSVNYARDLMHRLYQSSIKRLNADRH